MDVLKKNPTGQVLFNVKEEQVHHVNKLYCSYKAFVGDWIHKCSQFEAKARASRQRLHVPCLYRQP